MSAKTVLYVRTDIGSQNLTAGGSVTHTTGVINGMLHAGHTVLCASSALFTILPTLHLKKLWLLKNPQLLRVLGCKLNALFSNIFFTLQTLLFVRATKIDYLYQRYSMLNITGVLVKKIKKIPLILEFNGSEIWVDKHWTQKRRFKLTCLIAWAERVNIYHADTIVVVSAPLKDALIKQGVDAAKILVNPNGVDTAEFNPAVLAPQRKSIKKQLHINNTFVVGFIGTFSAWHGINILAEMIPQVVQKNPNVHFLLIGTGPLQAQLQQVLQEKNIVSSVTFTGSVDHAQAREYLAVCDAFLSPTQPNTDGSPFFGSPTKLFEYMSMAKPIIASDLEQVGSVMTPAFTINSLSTIVNKEIGIKVQPHDVQGFCKAVLFLAECSTQMLQRMGANAREKALHNYTWNNHVHNIFNFTHTSCK